MIKQVSIIHFNQLINFIKKDPILDWLEVYGKDRNFKKDKSMYFDYILQKSQEFKKIQINKILKQLKNVESFPNTTNYYSKSHLLKNIFINSNFIGKYKLSCKIHILLKGFLVNKLFNIQVDEKKYFQIHIAYITGKLKKNKLLANDQKHLLLKTKLYYNYKILKNLKINISSKTIIIFRNLKNSNSNWKLYDLKKSEVKHLLKKSILWKLKLQKAIKKNKLTPYIYKQLLPNMKNKNDYPWSTAKRKIAEKTNEITQIWNLNLDDKKFLLKKYGVTNWLNIQKHMLEFKKNKQDQIYNIIDINRSINSKFIINNKKNIDSHIVHKNYLEIYLDLETLSNVFFKKNLDQFTFLIGAIFINNYTKTTKYKYYLVESICEKEEKRIFHEFITDVNVYSKLSNGKIPIFHWGHIEQSTFSKIKIKHNIDHCLNFIDLNIQFKKSDIFIRGAFNYSLKSIGKALFNQQLIHTKWEEDIGNGLDAMVEYYMLKDIKDNNTKNNRLQQIIEYNYIDVKVLKDIVDWIRRI
uniref:YprB ribonuclease H-like domain-containing protein n=1 Tax=viral metagenome TaxID=1070528 RepID=A0A6C0LWI1_9ZZZZ